ncbi:MULTISPECIES: hypothetical protein [Micrococcaceae]|uniref:hypothetical protein n=1 Tax=Micrococcaceae TaxID=1268 RepID=UPI000BB89E59|nr:hypothetical protein [Glutamicibacter sp. BW78]PCC25746.1 hypothetical protein CIK75_04485 [Glutamicibacter sp. BW78]
MSADSLSTLLVLGAAAATAATAFICFRQTPRLVFTAWAICLFFVPVWIGAQIGVFLSCVTVLGLLIIASGNWARLSFSTADVFVAAFVLLVFIAYAFGWTTWGYANVVLIAWTIPYLTGRIVLSKISTNWLYSTIAIAASVAAILAIIEFMTGTNIFVLAPMHNRLYSVWGSLQVRGGLVRAEGAFGHSIALGAALAMSSAFILSTKWPIWVRLTLLGTVALATGITLSRIGLVGLVVTTVVSLIFLKDHITRSARVATIAMLTLVAAVGIPKLVAVFTRAGQEASGSAEYRADLFVLLKDISPLGIASNWSVLPNGKTYYGTFQSIDSEMVLTALRFGFLPLLFLLFGLSMCVWTVVRGRATPASVALLGQIPGLATVALITQYATFVWFVAGLAVATSCLRQSSGPNPGPEPNTHIPRQEFA